MGVMLIIQARFGVQAAAREAAMAGAQVNSSIDPYQKAIDTAMAEATRVLDEHGLDHSLATITFDGTPQDMARGALFRVHIVYSVLLPAPTVMGFFSSTLHGYGTFKVDSIGVVPIQKHKARWPCPSPDPICS
jgi:hypothetical protein